MPNVGASMEYNSLHIAGFHCREKGSVAFINDCLLPLDISASRAAGCAAWGAGRAALLGWADTAMWVSLRPGMATRDTRVLLSLCHSFMKRLKEKNMRRLGVWAVGPQRCPVSRFPLPVCNERLQ